MRYLILGGAGFLGANLVRRCLQEPESEVTVVDSLEYPPDQLPNNLISCWDRISYIRGNICNAQLLKEVVPGHNVVFHCAAQSSHLRSLENPFRDAETNLEGCLKVLEAIRFFNRDAFFIYPSTTSVLGKKDIYTVHKRAAENYIEIYHRLYALKTVTLRFGNLYGLFGRPEPEYGFVNHFIHRAYLGQTLEVFGSGEQTRNLTFVDDAASILHQAAFCPQLIGQTLFATSPFYRSVRQIAEEIVRVFESGSVTSIPWPHERQQIEIGSLKFSSHKLKKISGWSASTDFRSGLERTYQVMKSRIPA